MPDWTLGPLPRDQISQLALYHAGLLVHPSHLSLTKNSIIGDEVVPAIAHDSAKCPNTSVSHARGLRWSKFHCHLAKQGES